MRRSYAGTGASSKSAAATNTVNVEIFDEKNVQIDLPFYLAVFC